MHPRSRNPTLAIVALAMLATASCAPRSAGAPAGASVARETGTYRFEVRSAGELVIEGWFNAAADTVIVRATPGPCRYDADSKLRTAIVYECADRTVSFDRRYPVSRAYVNWTRRRSVMREVCTQQAVNAQGALVCSRRERERAEELVPASARIEPIRQPAP